MIKYFFSLSLLVTCIKAVSFSKQQRERIHQIKEEIDSLKETIAEKEKSCSQLYYLWEIKNQQEREPFQGDAATTKEKRGKRETKQ